MRALFALAAAGSALVLFACDPASAAIYPGCPFHWLTGWYCPVCGSLRGLHALLHGHPLDALRCNALTIAVVMWGVAVLAASWWRGVDDASVVAQRVSRWRLAGLLAIAAGFAVVRNLGFAWALRP